MVQREDRKAWLKERAREFRKALTRGEKLLWEALRGARLDGYKFRRQDPYRGYVVDLRCPRSRLIVEVDGDVHDKRGQADQERDAVLRGVGHEVLRIPDDEVRNRLEAVLAMLRRICRQRDTRISSDRN